MLKPVLLFLAMLFSSAALANQPGILITSPTEGAKLDALAPPAQLTYEVMPGAEGDHTHLYVDDKEVAILRQKKGTHTLPKLAPGEHNICIKLVNQAHTPVGTEKCIKVTVQ